MSCQKASVELAKVKMVPAVMFFAEGSWGSLMRNLLHMESWMGGRELRLSKLSSIVTGLEK
jgi:hypothetical protein